MGSDGQWDVSKFEHGIVDLSGGWDIGELHHWFDDVCSESYFVYKQLYEDGDNRDSGMYDQWS